jgi:hypothetical protein
MSPCVLQLLGLSSMPVLDVNTVSAAPIAVSQLGATSIEHGSVDVQYTPVEYVAATAESHAAR